MTLTAEQIWVLVPEGPTPRPPGGCDAPSTRWNSWVFMRARKISEDVLEGLLLSRLVPCARFLPPALPQEYLGYPANANARRAVDAEFMLSCVYFDIGTGAKRQDSGVMVFRTFGECWAEIEPAVLSFLNFQPANKALPSMTPDAAAALWGVSRLPGETDTDLRARMRQKIAEGLYP